MSAAWVAPEELNIYAASESGASLRALMAGMDAGDVLRVDLSQVSEIDASGLQLLLSIALEGSRDGCKVHFSDVPDAVRERFNLLGIGAYLESAAVFEPVREDA